MPCIEDRRFNVKYVSCAYFKCVMAVKVCGVYSGFIVVTYIQKVKYIKVGLSFWREVEVDITLYCIQISCVN
jgi:hypothetical protein